MSPRLLSAAVSGCIAFSLIAPAFAAEGAMKATATVDLACMQTAITTREDALLGGWNTHSSSVAAAYSARKTALLAAWTKTVKNERRAAINAAWQAFKTARQTARKQWNTSQKSAWDAFKNAAKTCRGTAEADISGAAIDAQ